MITSAIFSQVIGIAKLASDAILEIYHRADFSNTIDFKQDNSPLTLADKNAHNVILKGLQNLAVQYPIISEESDTIDYLQRKDWKKYWLVDPLDGTKEFIKRNGEFTVNIALMENNHPVWGVIYLPVNNICYYGGKQYGAFKVEAGKSFEIKTSSNISNLTAVGSRSHVEESFAEQSSIVKSLIVGSSIKFCWVAEGLADIYERPNPTMEWDTAAGQAIVEGAGGVMTTLAKTPFLYNKENMLNGGFICSNGKV